MFLGRAWTTAVLIGACSAVALAQGGRRFTMPPNLAEACINAEHCEGAVHWVKQTDWYVERQCTGTANLAEKKLWMNELINLQKIVDLLGLEKYDDTLLRDLSELCGGLDDLNTTYIDVAPPGADLLSGETITLTATIGCSNGTCAGGLAWFSDAPLVASVDVATGRVTAGEQGTATVYVVSTDLPFLIGSATIYVDASRTYALTSGEVNGTGTACNSWCCEADTWNYYIEPSSLAVVQTVAGQSSMQATVATGEMFLWVITAGTDGCGSGLRHASPVYSLAATGSSTDTVLQVTGGRVSGGTNLSFGLEGAIGTATITDSTIVIDVSHTTRWGSGAGIATFTGQLVFTRVPTR